VRVKVSTAGGAARRKPEFEDVRRIAESTGLAAIEVYRQLEREVGEA
jgi:uncharacterized protein (DUF111 family)